MTAGSWILWAVLAASAIGASLWHYHRRETPGRGRTLLAVLRGVALALLLLLLFDPELPAGRVDAARSSQVLLDASLSMQLPAERGATRWQRGVVLARERAGNRPVLLFGDRARPVATAALPDSLPGDGRTRLLPALQAAAEAGVRRVLVITDGGIEDADAVARWSARLGLDITTEIVGNDVASAAINEVSAPAWVEAGSPAVVEFGVTGSVVGDSVSVVALRDGRVVGRATVAAPAAGRIAAGTLVLRLDAPAGGGWVPLQLALEQADAVPDDDRRDLFVHVSAEPAGITIVSLRPDWEPRFLAPVLEQALGLPLRAFLRGATGQFVRLGTGLQAGVPVSEEEVRRAVERGELLVIHGAGVDAPAWAAQAIARARRILIFPVDDGSRLPLPAQLGPELQGDFFPAPAVPASPVAPLLAELETSGVAPLSSMRTAELSPGAWAPLLVTRGRQGVPQPMVIAGETAGRRWAIALGTGYWQWAFRGGAERQLYARLWSALAGWLARERDLASLAAVRPARMTNPRGAPMPWLAPGVAADSIAVSVTAADGAVVFDTVVAAATRDSAYTAAPLPGQYRYRARAFAGDTVVEGEGVFAVERYSPEYARPRADLRTLSALTPASERDTASRAQGTPLHATAYPYLLIVLLLAAEWVLRRRWGLR